MTQIHMVIGLFCLLLTLAGCAEFENTNKMQVVSGLFETSQLKDSVNVEVQPTTNPERYMVYFGWPKLDVSKQIRIRLNQTLATVSPQQTTFSHEVDHNQILTYSFDVLNEASKVEQSFSKIVAVPRDFVVRKNQNEFFEDQKLKVKRIFLSGSSPLRTNGYNIEIQAEYLFSEKGTIETFSSNSRAAEGTNGLSAGNLVLKIQNATGQMTIVMRAQNGGHGKKGLAHLKRAPDGMPPTNGQRLCECRKCRIQRSCYCATTGADGTNGANGAKGNSGGQGGAGGSTGNLKVEIENGSEFILKTDSQIGFGGNPGEGGEGQLGGHAPSGNGGACSGSPGQNGAQGPKGEPGLRGEDGNLGLICVYIASEGKNDCY